MRDLRIGECQKHDTFLVYSKDIPSYTGTLCHILPVLVYIMYHPEFRAGVPRTILDFNLGYHLPSQIPSWVLCTIPGHILACSSILRIKLG